MKTQEWMESARKSWGIFLKMDSYRNPRIDLLLHCEIKGECWVSSKETITIARKRIHVQRAAYGLFEGPIYKGDVVLATCGTELCCWGGHLHRVPRATIAEARKNREMASRGA